MQGVYSGKELTVQLEPYQVNLCPLGVGSQNSIWLLGQGSYRGGAANHDGAVNVCFGNGRGNNNVLEEAEGTDLVCAGLSVVREGILVQSCACWLWVGALPGREGAVGTWGMSLLPPSLASLLCKNSFEKRFLQPHGRNQSQEIKSL